MRAELHNPQQQFPNSRLTTHLHHTGAVLPLEPPFSLFSLTPTATPLSPPHRCPCRPPPARGTSEPGELALPEPAEVAAVPAAARGGPAGQRLPGHAAGPGGEGRSEAATKRPERRSEPPGPASPPRPAPPASRPPWGSARHRQRSPGSSRGRQGVALTPLPGVPEGGARPQHLGVPAPCSVTTRGEVEPGRSGFSWSRTLG